jgi:hypothetical protein
VSSCILDHLRATFSAKFPRTQGAYAPGSPSILPRRSGTALGFASRLNDCRSLHLASSIIPSVAAPRLAQFDAIWNEHVTNFKDSFQILHHFPDFAG